MIRFLASLLAVLLVLVRPAAAAERQEPLVIDLSDHLVAITTGFTGATVLLFGTAEHRGDVVVVVRGPTETLMVRRKERVMGIWVNRAQAVFTDIPAFYRVASSRPLDEVAPAAVQERYHIGVGHLEIPVRRKDPSRGDGEYAEALMRLKDGAGLYGVKPGEVNFVGGRLFRTEMEFPANVPTGSYTVEVYLIQDGKVIGSRTTPLIVSKTGIGAEIFDFAHRRGALYGLSAILLAIFAGWLGAVVFRRL
ncbi:MAG TPA: TIGR02186 family protein [Rhodospirillaceae bacterium]|nr:TIGR02186 family protein [Rhodospirillaceae bacterium]